MYCLASIPNSTLFVSGSGDGICSVWSAKDGSEVGKDMNHGDWVFAIVVSKDGKTMASGGYDGRIVVWSLESREKINEWETSESWVNSLAMSQDSTRVASGHENGTTRIWNVSTGSLIAGPYQLHDRWVESVSFSPGGSQIATGGHDHHIRVTYIHSGEDVVQPFQALVWLPNGQLVSASDDQTIKYWDASDGSLIATSHGHTAPVVALATSSDGKLLASAAEDATARLWDTSTHRQIGPALQHHARLLSVALSSNSDGHYLVASEWDSRLWIWNLSDIEEVAKTIPKIAVVAEVQPPSSSAGDKDAAEIIPEDRSGGESLEEPKDDERKARKEPDWLDQPATGFPNMSGEISEVSHYARGGAFWAGMEESAVGTDQGKAKAQGVTVPDELRSHEERRLLVGFNKKILKPFRAIGKSSKSPRDSMEGSIPAQSAHSRLIAALKKPGAVPMQSTQVGVEPPSTKSLTSPELPPIQSSDADPSHQPSRSSLWRRTRSSSSALEVTPITPARGKEVNPVARWPTQKRLPHWLKPNDPKNKPWHKYLLKKQEEYSAVADSDETQHPSPPVLSPPENAGSSSTTQQGTQPARKSAFARTGSHSQPAQARRPPSIISLTSCEMCCLWFWRSEPRWRR
ncbi:hypothetical protein PAXINDRAFT_171583 [Paxillus involutus ATCC 200175]|uniref:WD40 repeat-like protein n=1 Tax=Paxillus involutus ATCC 200175 TaxID=664439 RepID=A0A0C9TVT2_PAXIN|nr:hypothetical protein PAXINDRAFT_171583 [Paxillus involutus ATCC 200175]